MRLASAALAALVAGAAPAAAQVCDCGPGAYVEEGPATVIVPRTTYVPHTRYAPRTVLVPRTRLVPRVVYVPRTRLVPRIVEVPHTVYSAHTSYARYPASGGYGAYGWSGGPHHPADFRNGAVYVPPGATSPCSLGRIGCDSGFVGPLGGFGSYGGD